MFLAFLCHRVRGRDFKPGLSTEYAPSSLAEKSGRKELNAWSQGQNSNAGQPRWLPPKWCQGEVTLWTSLCWPQRHHPTLPKPIFISHYPLSPFPTKEGESRLWRAMLSLWRSIIIICFLSCAVFRVYTTLSTEVWVYETYKEQRFDENSSRRWLTLWCPLFLVSTECVCSVIYVRQW